MKDRARVVVIGGGVGGCAVAYWLTKLDLSDVVLLERADLTSGSTFHSAGLVGQLRGSPSQGWRPRRRRDLDRGPRQPQVDRLRVRQDPEQHRPLGLEELERIEREYEATGLAGTISPAK